MSVFDLGNYRNSWKVFNFQKRFVLVYKDLYVCIKSYNNIIFYKVIILVIKKLLQINFLLVFTSLTLQKIHLWGILLQYVVSKTTNFYVSI